MKLTILLMTQVNIITSFTARKELKSREARERLGQVGSPLEGTGLWQRPCRDKGRRKQGNWEGTTLEVLPGAGVF